MREPYEIIASIGDWCAPAANIRRRFGISEAMPFDWWVSPYNATVKLLEERFANLLRSENLEVINERSSVRCNYYGILHHHDFSRDEHGQIVPDIVPETEKVAAKFKYIIDRFHRSFKGKRALFIRNNLAGELWAPGSEPHPTIPLQIERATKLHTLIRNQLLPRQLDLIVLGDVEPGTTLELDGGSVIFENLGQRIKEVGFWDENYDLLFERLGIELRPVEN